MSRDRQPRSHPLMWAELLHQVTNMSGENPEVWIEDVRRYGPPKPERVETVGEGSNDETDCMQASFSVVHDTERNRIIIRTHY